MRVFLAFLVGLTSTLAFGWWGFPKVLYVQEPQPLQFNHLAHKEKAGTECSSCHEFGEDGQFAGIPKLSTCAQCHAEPVGTTEAEKQLVARFVKPEKEIPWKAYSRQPVNVRFSHAVHVKKAALKCETCHGDRGSATMAEPFSFNRISGESRNIWGPRMTRVGLRPGEAMKMGDCESCHAQRGATADCFGCHR